MTFNNPEKLSGAGAVSDPGLLDSVPWACPTYLDRPIWKRTRNVAVRELSIDISSFCYFISPMNPVFNVTRRFKLSTGKYNLEKTLVKISAEYKNSDAFVSILEGFTADGSHRRFSLTPL